MQDVMECERLPVCGQFQTPMRLSSIQTNPPRDGFWQFVLKFCGHANRLLQQLFGWLVSDDHGGEQAGCGGPGLARLHGVCDCEAGWMHYQILWNAFADGLRERNENSIQGQQLWWTFFRPACRLHAPSKPATSLAACCLIKLHFSEWPWIAASTCAVFMSSHQHLGIPVLWGGLFILAKEKCSPEQFYIDLWTIFKRNGSFVITLDLWAHLMKSGSKNKSVYICV